MADSVHTAKAFKEDAGDLIEQLNSLIGGSLKDTGDAEADSQKITLLNRLYAFESAVNGTEDADIIGG